MPCEACLPLSEKEVQRAREGDWAQLTSHHSSGFDRDIVSRTLQPDLANLLSLLLARSLLCATVLLSSHLRAHKRHILCQSYDLAFASARRVLDIGLARDVPGGTLA